MILPSILASIIYSKAKMAKMEKEEAREIKASRYSSIINYYQREIQGSKERVERMLTASKSEISKS